MHDNHLLLQYYPQLLLIKQQLSDRFGRERRDRLQEIWVLGNIGAAYYRLGELHQVLNRYNLALSLTQKNEKISQTNLFSLMGKAYKDLGELQKALDYYHRALSIKKNLVNRYEARKIAKSINELEVELSSQK